MDDNLHMREDKSALSNLAGQEQGAAAANARFFTSVEGLFALNEEEVVDGLFVITSPALGLARAGAGG